MLPIHRLLRSPDGLVWSSFEERARQYFSIQPVDPEGIFSLIGNQYQERVCFGIYLGESKYYLLCLKDTIDPCEVIKGSLPMAWKTLDVTLFQTILLEISLQMSIKTMEEQNILGLPIICRRP